MSSDVSEFLLDTRVLRRVDFDRELAREPVISAEVARQRLGRSIDVARGPAGTLILRVADLSLGIVQPEYRTREALRRATHDAKADLVVDMKQRSGAGLQGVVYLPRYAVITHSASGAADMAAKRLSMVVEVEDEFGGDPLDHAADYLQGLLQRDARDQQHVDAFVARMRSHLSK